MGKFISKRIMFVLILFFIFLYMPNIGSSEIHVSKNGPITSIQDAIDQASQNDIIVVAVGYYTEQLIIDN